MPNPPRPARAQRNEHAYIKRRDALKRRTMKLGLPCHLCGNPFDWSLDWKHPMSFTADHIEPVATGGSMTGELRPAHRSCNSRRQTTPLDDVKPTRKPRHSQTW